MIKLNRTRNTIRNISYGFLYRAISLLLPFLTRTIVIYKLGTEYLGLNSVFSSILQVLNLAELGFGSAVVYCLYRPIAEQNNALICAYLNAFRKIYRIIGFGILLVGGGLIPVLPLLVKDAVMPGRLNLYLCYSVFLLDSVIGYLLFGYKTAIPQAVQRQDLVTKIDMGIVAAKNLCQICLIFLFQNFYLFLLAIPTFTIIRNLILVYLIDRRYPDYRPNGKLTEEQRKELMTRVKGIAIGKLCITSRNGIDSLCISSFIGLAAVAIYNNYYYIMNAVVSISMIFCTSVMPGVGNSIITESKEKNLSDMKHLEFIYMILAGWVAVCLFCLYQPFMQLWMGKSRMLGMPEVILFVIYFYLLKMGDLRWIYQEGAGLWWDCRYVTVVETILNLVLNILLGKRFGFIGILMATDLSMFFINFFGSANVVFSRYFGRERLMAYYLNHLCSFAINTCILAVSYGLCTTLTGWLIPSSLWLELVLCGVVCLLVPPGLYWIIYHKTSNFKYWREWIASLIYSRIQTKSP